MGLISNRNIKRKNTSNTKQEEQQKRKKEKKYFKDFKAFILKNDHPCLMAQAVLKASNATFKVYEGFDRMESTHRLKNDLEKFAYANRDDRENFQSFIAVFPDFRIYDEIDFEKLLWKRLQLLHDVDMESNSWDREVSPDPQDSNFSFSIAGTAFYVIGMHPESSRLSRRAPMSTLIFNFHNQFEKLKKDGVYHEVRNKIRQRDYMAQGSINPMLKDFGMQSEARQYSGRFVESNWKCPFQPNSKS